MRLMCPSGKFQDAQLIGDGAVGEFADHQW